jgi:2-polyprenyl-6-methoxyphenol hydroxylase-like FAD-dependent oxidoreductase
MVQKVVVVGAGPVGSLAALYAAVRGFEVEVYELRAGESYISQTISVLASILTLARSSRPQYHTPELFQVNQLGVIGARHQLFAEDWTFGSCGCGSG